MIVANLQVSLHTQTRIISFTRSITNYLLLENDLVETKWEVLLMHDTIEEHWEVFKSYLHELPKNHGETTRYYRWFDARKSCGKHTNEQVT